MFWADRVAEEVKEKLANKIESGKKLVVRDEKTLSGRVHIGSMRGVAIHGIVSEILDEKGISNEYLYEINDFDPMDGIPSDLDQKEYEKYLGKSLCLIPSPDGKAKNFAEYYANEFIGVITHSKFKPKFYRSSDIYKSGKYNECINDALLNAQKIREIYKRISGSVKPDDWMPLQVVCESCGKISTTKVVSYDGKLVKYECLENYVEWTNGCGNSGEISPFDGNAKLPWKVEWAAKFKIFDVDIEGAGKDHSTKGGSRDIANHISKEVFKHESPFDIPYEFLLVGGKKMSSSKGEGSSSKEVGDLLPSEIFRLFLVGKNPKKTLDFIPDGDTIPVLFDWYDKLAEAHFSKSNEIESRLFLLSHGTDSRSHITKHFLPRFSQIAFLTQMPHIDIKQEVAKMKESDLTKEDEEEIDSRLHYADKWLTEYAPLKFKYELQVNSVPEKAMNLDNDQKEALSLILEYVKNVKKLDGQDLHTRIHDIRKETNIEPKRLFGAIYEAFLSKDSGPKVGWFLSVLDRDFLINRLEEVTK